MATTKARQNEYAPRSPRNNCKYCRLIFKLTAIRMVRTWSALRRWQGWVSESPKCGFRILGRDRKNTFMLVKWKVISYWLKISNVIELTPENLPIFWFLFSPLCPAKVPRDTTDSNAYGRHINLQLTYSFQNNTHNSLQLNNNNNNNNSTKSSLFTNHGNFFSLFIPIITVLCPSIWLH